MSSGPPPTAAGEVSETAAWFIALLRPHTPFAEAIVRRQAERAGTSISKLTWAHLTTVGPMVFAAAQMFVDPAKLGNLRRQIGPR
jgi:hypothetical protein